ncbi:selenocysteine-specific translation elongation factor [Pelomonas sp. KK5]|uniref:selenocysteine-specific translation elongation factor n=1 Tax=Pelomonas sp. KK5 TaxID=1855730 RepID=UPI00097C361F|nr:selenocysteine-specific translation elongation factor [Pelomonas sp. KK5]
MIIGTAGHIDHGKTTLVRALTGVDTDRLPEEKKRGISIELGYAFSGDGAIGFVDVPGHERLVHTMLAGATGIDYALLLVAADDGPMPQTREHLAVLSLLGLERGAVVITKADRASAARLAEVRSEVEALRAGSALAQAPVLELSATTGQGVETLRQLLAAEAAHAVGRPAGRAFRLAVDRSFSLDGVGTVVTGTVHAGHVAIGDELALCPDGGHPRRLRVRSLHAQNRSVGVAEAGQRCALGLVGIAKDEVARGQWLVAPEAAAASERIDVQLRLWPAEPRALRSGTPVHVHLGARAVMGSVALLDAEALPPGGEALAQLVLHEPIGAWRGDRVVLRDASASRTMAGGVVLDPFAPARYRRMPQRLAELAALHAQPTPAARLQALLDVAPLGLDLERFASAEGIDAQARQDLAPDAGLLAGGLALSRAAAQLLAEQLRQRLADFHAAHPDEPGPEAGRLRRLAAPRLPEPLWRELLARGRDEGWLAQRGAFVHLPEHGVQLSALEQRIAQKVAPLLAGAGFEGAWVRDLARDAQEGETLMRATLARLAQQGALHTLVKDLYCAPEAVEKMAAIVRDLAAAAEGQVLAAAFRDATGLGRKRAIQVLEYFDRVGLLRRVGDVHKLRTDSRDLFNSA